VESRKPTSAARPSESADPEAPRGSIHPSAKGFGLGADAYEKGRPGYPPEAIAWLTEGLRIDSASTVVDLAAGTGKLSRQLLPIGCRVVGVEPVAAMRKVLSSIVGGVEVHAGTAEQIPLPADFADSVTVGQAFHWFDADRALGEIHRVLRPDGGLGLIWNRRDMDQPIQAQIHDIVERHRGSTPSHGSSDWEKAFERSRLFGPLSSASFAMTQTLDGPGLIARVMSISFMSQLEGQERRAAIERIGDIARRNGDRIFLDYVAEAYCCEAI